MEITLMFCVFGWTLDYSNEPIVRHDRGEIRCRIYVISEPIIIPIIKNLATTFGPTMDSNQRYLDLQSHTLFVDQRGI